MAEADIAPAYRTLCSHYARGCSLLVSAIHHRACWLNITVQAPCCGKVYPCRVCHDDAEDHKMDRKQVKTIQCRNCNELQEVKSWLKILFETILLLRWLAMPRARSHGY